MAKITIGEGTWASIYASLNSMFTELYSWGDATQRIYTLGGYTFRNVVRDGYLCTDQTKTATGFAGTEDTDWANIRMDKLA
jgi:hypothetical protein